MFFRRYFRIKSMQFLYAKYITNIDHNIVELTNSIDTLHNLYIYIIKLILIIRNKAKESFKKKSISDFFLKNNVINLLMNNIYISNFNEKLFQFHLINDDDILMLLNEFCNSSLYKDYINTPTSFLRDKNFLIKYYECFIMKKLYKVFEDNITLDLNYAHLMVYNTLKNINPKYNNVNLYKLNIDYKNFIINLYCKTLTNKFKFNKLISNVLINWDIKRIAILDLIVMHMAICEFLYFPNIPTKVTINEYIEIIKLFSTIKSPIFINGILDKILKILDTKIIKIGKGLLLGGRPDSNRRLSEPQSDALTY